jgi:hypothetical protein
MMSRTKATLAAIGVIALASLGLFAASASATFEATLVPRQASKRSAGPSFIVEAGGGRRTRIRNLEIEAGACGSIFVPLIDATRSKPGFAAGKGAAVFALSDQDLQVRLELRVKPRGEGLTGSGLFKATIGACHERLSLDLVSATIRGGGRHKPTR